MDEDVKLVNSAAADVGELEVTAEDVGSVGTTEVLDGSVLVDGGTVTTVVDVTDCDVDVGVWLLTEDDEADVEVGAVLEADVDCVVETAVEEGEVVKA